MFWLYRQPSFEQFVDVKIDAEQLVINTYNELLNRQPTPSELKRDANQLEVGLLSVNGLQQRIIDSDEYNRIIKLQSNELAPELRKMTYEKKTLTHISDMYMDARRIPVNPKILLPLRDIFIYIEYNEIALRMVLQSPKWGQFEEDLLNAFQLSKEEVIEMFEKTFVKAVLLDNALKSLKTAKYQVSSIQDPPPEVASKPILNIPQAPRTVASVQDPTILLTERFVNEVTAGTSSTTLKKNRVADVQDTLNEGFDVSEYPIIQAALIGPKPIRDGKPFVASPGNVLHKDPDSTPMFEEIEKTAKKVFDKDAAAKALDSIPAF